MIAATADEYVVDAADELLRCTLRGTLWQDRGKEDTALVVVGDEVVLTPGPEGQGVIEEVLPRRNALGRGREFQAYGAKSRRRRSKRAVRKRADQILAANVDQALLVFAAAEPRPNFSKVDQLIVAALSEDLPALLCINKMDLADPSLDAELEYYRPVPVEILKSSAVLSQGIDEIRGRMAGRTTVLWGPSGVGKSTLINAMWPGINQKVGQVSAMTGMGTHTTRAVEMLRAEGDTWVVDTPGWRHFTPRTATRHAIDTVLWDVSEAATQCRFSDCRHDREPGCAVREGVESGELDPRRVELHRELIDLIER